MDQDEKNLSQTPIAEKADGELTDDDLDAVSGGTQLQDALQSVQGGTLQDGIGILKKSIADNF